MARRQGATKPSRGGSGRASSGRGGKGPQRSQGYQGKRQQDGRSQGRFGRPQQGAPRPAGRGDARRGGSKGDLIEGRRAVSEALDLGLPVMRALIQKDSGNADPALTELARRLAADGVEVERVAKPILDSLSSHGAHQGVMLRVRPYRYASLRDVIDAAGEGNALVIVLDHVTDEGNFGAIVRTAEVVSSRTRWRRRLQDERRCRHAPAHRAGVQPGDRPRRAQGAWVLGRWRHRACP